MSNSNLPSDYPVSGFSNYSGSSNEGQADKRLKKFKFPLTSWVVEKGIKLVVFDKDGTLIEFQNYWCKWAKSFVSSLVELYNSLPIGKRRPILRSRPFPEGFLYDFLGCNKDTGKVENKKGALCLGDMVIIKQEVLNFFRTYVNLPERDLQIYFDNAFEKAIDAIKGDIKALGSNPGCIKELFQELKDNDCKIAIFTSDVSYATNKALKVLDVDKFFADNPNLILCSDSDSDSDIRFKKPSGAALRYLADQAGLIKGASVDQDNLWKSEVLMVGDSKTDIMSAEEAEVSSLFVESGLFDENALRENGLSSYVIAASIFDDIRTVQKPVVNKPSFAFMDKNNINKDNINRGSSEAGL